MLDIRIWDVGHGLSVRIKTPSGQNHIIDAGGSENFSPAEHIKKYYWESNDSLDYLVISHFDQDHVNDLPNTIRLLGEPKTYLRNRTVPKTERYGSGDLKYQVSLKDLDDRYTKSIPYETSPCNPSVNGGVDIIHEMLSWEEVSKNFNNASIVMSYYYAGNMIIFPGDIEPEGWSALLKNNPNLFAEHIKKSNSRILIAPHHGRKSGYSQEMIDYLKPSIIVASDKYGAGTTDPRFYNAGLGLEIKGEVKSFVSTKTKGRKMIHLMPNGSVNFDE